MGKHDLPIVMLDEEPSKDDITFENMLRYLSDFLAGFGLAAFILVCWLAGLYFGGRV